LTSYQPKNGAAGTRVAAGKQVLATTGKLARKVLFKATMSLLENTCSKMAESDANALGMTETIQQVDVTRHISPVVAHELNNVITIIQGYADRLLFKHGENPALQPSLQIIAETARRAAAIVHDARPAHPNAASRQKPVPQSPAA
jgi:signal transduction histidine kinase